MSPLLKWMLLWEMQGVDTLCQPHPREFIREDSRNLSGTAPLANAITSNLVTIQPMAMLDETWKTECTLKSCLSTTRSAAPVFQCCLPGVLRCNRCKDDPKQVLRIIICPILAQAYFWMIFRGLSTIACVQIKPVQRAAVAFKEWIDNCKSPSILIALLVPTDPIQMVQFR